MAIKVIITGATGLVGEGVLLECLQNPEVGQVLLVNRKPYGGPKHPKLKEILVPDFFTLDGISKELTGYNACFFCAGISSAGMGEKEYTHITYDTTLHFAGKLASLNPAMVFDFVSGTGTDSTEKSRIMWARVKGRTENALMRLPFKGVYNFRPGFMKPMDGQQNIKGHYKVIAWLYPVLHSLFPNYGNTVQQLALAMINSVLKGYPRHIMEVKDTKLLSKA